MPVQLVTIDFWNTLVSAKSNGALRERARINSLLENARQVKPEITEAHIKQALKKASEVFDEIWLGTSRTLQTQELVELIESELQLDFTSKKDVIKSLQESLLAGPPEWAEGVHEVLEILSSRYYLSIISDTMYSPGRVLRSFLERGNALKHFLHFVFSDEIGHSKPHARTFQSAHEASGCLPENAVHIGDMKQTDIRGAKAFGMKAILFAGLNKTDAENSGADAVAFSWGEIPAILERWE